MRYRASDFRTRAREALRGRWKSAILVYLVASTLGVSSVLTGFSTSGGSISLPDELSGDVSYSYPWEDFVYDEEMLLSFLIVFAVAFLIALVLGAVLSIPRSALQLGYANFNLNLVDDTNPRFADLFTQFRRIGSTFVMNFLVSLYTALWSFLFIIPGYIKAYSYSMSSFVLLDHPEFSANEAITHSRRLMKGNKWRLFCLNLSFIGWELLITAPLLFSAAATPIIAFLYARNGNENTKILLLVAIAAVLLSAAILFAGELFLMPYRNAAQAVFYRRIVEEQSGIVEAPRYYPVQTADAPVQTDTPAQIDAPAQPPRDPYVSTYHPPIEISVVSREEPPAEEPSLPAPAPDSDDSAPAQE